MVRNLIRVPLIAVCLAALIWYIQDLLPWSEAYAQALAVHTVSPLNLLLLLVSALLVCAGMAVAYTGERIGQIPFVLMLTLSSIGLSTVVPSLRPLVLGAEDGILATGDILFRMLNGGLAILLAILLAMQLMHVGGRKPGEAPPPAAKYKLRVIALIVRIICMPFLYFVLYFVSWYFLYWRNTVVREFHGGAELMTFMQTLMDILANNTIQAVTALLVGLGYALFSLPLLFRLMGKRVLYIISVTLFNLAGAAAYLAPNAVLPQEVRMAHFLETAAVMLVYGVLCSLTLHTAIRKVQEAPAPVPARPVRRPQPGQARPAGQRPAAAASQAEAPQNAETAK